MAKVCIGIIIIIIKRKADFQTHESVKFSWVKPKIFFTVIYMFWLALPSLVTIED